MKELYAKYATAYKSSKRRNDQRRLDKSLENKAVGEVKKLKAAMEAMQEHLTNAFKDVMELPDENLKCSGDWTTKATEKQARKDAKAQRKAEKKAEKQQQEGK